MQCLVGLQMNWVVSAWWRQLLRLRRASLTFTEDEAETGGVVVPSGGLLLKNTGKNAIRSLIPLSIRKRMAVWVHRQQWINSDRRSWWSVELVRDLAETDVDAFHKFLWTHHLSYAQSYEAAGRFGGQNIKASRRIFFSDVREQAAQLEPLAEQSVRSIFEVGCSLGYLLRFIETDVFPRATELAGIDIDRYAIESGSKYLHSVGSKVVLECGDTRELERWLGGKTYDLIVCTGVLMYLNQSAADEAIATMLRHGRLLAMAGLAHARFDNATLHHSDVRTSDRTFVHNFDRMVTDHGGRVVWRRWEGARDVDGNTIYFVFATAR
jgi:SAM-dependent methyltransferase